MLSAAAAVTGEPIESRDWDPNETSGNVAVEISGSSDLGGITSHDPFSAMFSSSRLAMWVYDHETHAFLAVNDSAVARYGYSRDEFLSMRIFDIRPEPEKARLAADRGSPRRPLEWSGPWMHRLADGSVMQVAVLSHEVTFSGRPAVLVTVSELPEHGQFESYGLDVQRLGPGAGPSDDPAEMAPTREELLMAEELVAAIPKGQLKVHYQPVIDLVDSRIAGAEALVRWERPGHGLVLPGKFIPTAEKTGLIARMWPQILHQALADKVRWQTQIGQPLTVAVNLSARQFDDPTTVDHVVAALQVHGVDPADLVIEITETAAVANPPRMQEIVSGFRLLGVRVALDDFGTGYATLSYLQQTPFDILKIDRSFTARIATDRRQHQIVSGVVRLAHSLGMTVIAEGVEEAGQLDRLLKLKVEQGQGYHLGRPSPPAAFGQSLLVQHSAH